MTLIAPFLLQGNRSRRASDEVLKRAASKGGALVVGRMSSQDSLPNYVPPNVTPAIERMLQVGAASALAPAFALALALCSFACSL